MSSQWHQGSVYLNGGQTTSILGDPGAVSLVGRKGRTKVFKYGRKSPWVPTVIELFPKIQADAGSYYYYYCAQSANSFSWVIFMSSYTTPIVWPHSARFRSPSLCVQGKLLFSTFLTRNEGTTDESKKHCDAISRSNWICPENILFLTDHNVS